jgi:hypothetical protein
MTHEQAAHFKLLAEPSLSLDNLRSMRVDIDGLLAFLSSESTGIDMGMRRRHADIEDRQPGLFDQDKPKLALTTTQTAQLAKLVEGLLVDIAVAMAIGEAGNEQDNPRSNIEGESPPAGKGIQSEMLRVSKTGLLLPEEADGGAKIAVCQLGARSGL